MKILDMNILGYMDVLKTKAPAPGGGAVAGLTAAQGISLTLMVLDLTLGKEKYQEFEELNKEVQEKCNKIYDLLVNAADDDYAAYTKLSEAYKLPKDSEEEKMKRKDAIENTAIAAIESPLKVIELCRDAAVETQRIVGKSNNMAISDLGVAAECFKSASKSSWLNVKINIPCISDQGKKEYYMNRAKILLDEIDQISNDIYDKVENAL